MARQSEVKTFFLPPIIQWNDGWWEQERWEIREMHNNEIERRERMSAKGRRLGFPPYDMNKNNLITSKLLFLKKTTKNE